MREVVGAGDMTPYRTRMQHLGVGDGALGDPPSRPRRTTSTSGNSGMASPVDTGE